MTIPCPSDSPAGRASERYCVLALQAKQAPRLVRRRDLAPEVLENRSNLSHLLGVAACELALRDEQAVLEPDAHVAAEQRGLRAEAHLMTPGRERGEHVIVAEQAVGDGHHVRDVAHVGSDAA